MNQKSAGDYVADAGSGTLTVAYLDDSPGPGGAETLLLQLIEGLTARGASSLLYCRPYSWIAEQGKTRGIAVRELSLPRFMSLSLVFRQRKILNPVAVLWAIIQSGRSVARLVSALRLTRPAVVQTNTLFSHVYGGTAARILGVPCVWYFHDLVETARFFGLMRFFWKILGKVLRVRIVGDSEAVISRLGIDGQGTAIHPGYPETKEILAGGLRHELRLGAGAHIVGYVGRIAYSKGVDVLVEAARIVTEQLSSVHFVVIGDAGSADKPYKRALVDRIQKYRMVSTWHWLGFRSNPQALLADVDIVALPSRREAFSLVPLEAGIGCKPVVASDVGGIPETIVDRVTGRLVLPGDPRLLADVIVELLKSPDQAEALGKAAGERVRQKFNPELYFQKFQSVYKAIVDEQ